MKTKLQKRGIFFVLLCCLVLTLFPVKAMAAQSSATASLDTNAKNVEFKITFDSPGTYQATLQGPDDSDQYTYTRVSDTVMSVTVDNASKGDWITTVTSSGTVGKYSVSVQGKKDTDTKAVDGNIRSGADIVGLRYHFKDRTLIADWDNTGAGQIYCVVTNLDNSQVIDSKTVNSDDSTEYQCEIPEGVTRITFGAVPTSSQNIDGAMRIVNLDLPTKPDATVEFTKKYSNKEETTLHVVLNQPYGFYVEDNGKKTYSEDTREAGDYNVTIPLNFDGANKISFYLVDSSGNMYSYKKTIIRDTTAPKLTMGGQYNGKRVSTSRYTIKGKATSVSTVTINGKEIEVASDGVFSSTLSLHNGANKFTLKAEDEAGNVTTYEFTLNYGKKAFNPRLLIFPLILILIVFLIRFLKKGKTASLTSPLSKEKQETVKKKSVKPSVTASAKEPIKRPAEEKMPKYASPKGLKSVFSKESSDDPIREQVQKSGKSEEERARNRAENIHMVVTVGAVVIAALFVFHFLLMNGKVMSGSMEPTLKTGQYFVANRLAYVKKSPKRGDIISFKNGNKLLIKRVIGVAGDKVTFHDGYVYINGKKLDESAYLDPDVETNCMDSFKVPSGSVFVLGDNRENSSDSRDPKEIHGHYVPIKNIVAKYLFTLPYPY